MFRDCGVQLSRRFRCVDFFGSFCFSQSLVTFSRHHQVQSVVVCKASMPIFVKRKMLVEAIPLRLVDLSDSFKVGITSTLHGVLRVVPWVEKLSPFQETGETTKIQNQDMGVSKNRGTPKWMVYNGKPF